MNSDDFAVTLQKLREADREPVLKLLREYSHRVEQLEEKCELLRLTVRAQQALLEDAIPDTDKLANKEAN